MQKISPFLWFNSNAEEAVKFYVSIFKNSRILTVNRYDEQGAKAAGRPKGSVMIMVFQIEGQKFFALNGGPHFKFSGAISFLVECKTQKEIDHLWKKLSYRGKELQCGWVTDRFGVTWQIVPSILGDLMQDKDPRKSQRVMEAMLKMVKLDIKKLKQAYNQK